jgi:hypothetical protein
MAPELQILLHKDSPRFKHDPVLRRARRRGCLAEEFHSWPPNLRRKRDLRTQPSWQWIIPSQR